MKRQLFVRRPIYTGMVASAWVLMAFVVRLAAATPSTPTVQWAVAAGSPYYDGFWDMAVTSTGEILVAGVFDGVIDDVYSPRTVMLRFDPLGNQIGSQPGRGEVIQGVAVDAKGNYVVTGYILQPASLGVGDRNHFYLAKYSPQGNLLWERTGGLAIYEQGVKYNEGRSVAIDASGNIHVVGTSYGNATYDQVTFPTGPGGPLLCKYAPDGTLLWARRVENNTGISQNGGWGGSLALDSAGNVITSGYIKPGTANIGGLTVTASGDDQSYIAKYGSNGEVQWVVLRSGEVAVDRQDNIYFSGFWGCGKLSPDGEAIWLRTLSGQAYPSGLILDGNGEPIIAASFEGTVRLGDIVVKNERIEGRFSYPNLLIYKLDSAGQFQWALPGGHGMSIGAGKLAAGTGGRFYVAGRLGCGFRGYDNGGWIDCGPGMLGEVPLSPVSFGGDTDVWLASLQLPSPANVELKMTKTASGVALSWPRLASGFVLERADSIPGGNWTEVAAPPAVEGEQNVLPVEIGPGSQFFRLRGP